MKYAAISLMVLVSIVSSSWEYDVDTDPITDEAIVLLKCRASSGVNSWGERPYLYVRFTDGEDIEVFIYWDTYVGSSNLNCIVRIDDAEARTYRVNASTSNKATFFYGTSDMEELFVEMLDGTELICRFTPYNENPITAKFSLYGLTSSSSNGGIDLESYHERVAEIEAARCSGIITINGETDTLTIGEEFVFQGETHTILEIDFIRRSSSISKVRIVPTSELNSDERAEGCWATASQIDSYVTSQVAEEENQEESSHDGFPGKPENVAEAAAEPYEYLIGRQVIFFDEIYTIIDVDARGGRVRYEIVPGDSSQANFSAEGIIVSPEHVVIQ